MFKNSRKISLIMALMISLVLVISGCATQKSQQGATPSTTPSSGQSTPQGPAASAKSSVPTCKLEVVNGSSTVTLTEEELSAIESITMKATMTKKDGTSVEYEYVGLPMAKVLEAANVKDYKTVTATASDNYTCEYTSDMVKTAGSIIAYERDGEVLGDSGPLMTILKDEASSTWCKTLVKLTVAQ